MRPYIHTFDMYEYIYIYIYTYICIKQIYVYLYLYIHSILSYIYIITEHRYDYLITDACLRTPVCGHLFYGHLFTATSAVAARAHRGTVRPLGFP